MLHGRWISNGVPRGCVDLILKLIELGEGGGGGTGGELESELDLEVVLALYGEGLGRYMCLWVLICPWDRFSGDIIL